MPKMDYSQRDKESLIAEIVALKKRKKYGLMWEDKPEEVVTRCQSELPVLQEVKVLSIDTAPDLPTNLLIEGDNYHALSVLNYTHAGKIDVIYIDPPYNTGNNGWKYNDQCVDVNDGYRHSKWISMMNNRLRLAKNLLTQHGIVFVSIDDIEQARLKLLMDDIFGNENFVTCIARVTKAGGNKGELYKPKKDYVLFYANNKTSIKKIDYGLLVKKQHEWRAEYFNGEQREYILGDTPYRAGLEVRPNQRYYMKAPDGSLLIPPGNVFPKKKADAEQVKPQSEDDKCWSWSRDRYVEERKLDKVVFKKTTRSPFLDAEGKQSKWTVKKKLLKSDVEGRRDILSDYIKEFPNSHGTAELKKLGIPFGYPKPTGLIKHLIERVCKSDSVILDFFAGSGTTGHAVAALNKEDGGNRRYILCTNNENGIARKICQPRIKAVIKGHEKLPDITGIPSNLRYYETSFVDAAPTDPNKIELTKRATEMLCVREHTFDGVKSHADYRIFRNQNRYTGIIYDPEAIPQFKRAVAAVDGKFKVYVFSLGGDDFAEEFADLGGKVTVSSIPESILRAYRNIFKTDTGK